MNKTFLPLMGIAAFGLPLAPPTVASAQSSGGNGNYQATLDPVPTNMVNGSGTVTVSLSGNRATVSVAANRLLDNSPHAPHIHVKGSGECPKAEAGHEHKAISTSDGQPAYGKIGTSLNSRIPGKRRHLCHPTPKVSAHLPGNPHSSRPGIGPHG
ncbi:hypothetical protein AB0M87_20545 [Streptomyces sp. NPDC051320]|uniref:hypothetical protein n=1 Tax=Streptomyces sp. NPDC051320 TaxID=3154644 RepID=UPI003415AF8E